MPRLQHDDAATPQFGLVAAIVEPLSLPIVFTSHARLADETAAPLPIRLHLLHQTLLI
jgi:hypothetical protein